MASKAVTASELYGIHLGEFVRTPPDVAAFMGVEGKDAETERLMDLKKRFDALDNNLKLDPAERQRAQKTHNRLGDLLVRAGCR